MSEKKKRNIIIGVLCGVLLLMVVGYATFNSVLKINGTSNISGSWKVEITSITSKVLSGAPTNATEPTGVGTLEATFETDLVSPGDSMEYTITVTNNGTVNAELEKINLTVTGNEYVEFAATIGNETLEKGENTNFTEAIKTLNTGQSKEVKIVVTFKDEEINKLNNVSESLLKIAFDYQQESGSSSDTPVVPDNSSKTVYSDNLGATRFIGDTLESIGSTTEDYTTLGKNVFLKHHINNNVIESSEVCFIKNGLHCLVGGDKGTAYETNKELLLSIFGESCNIRDTDISCDDGSFQTYAGDDGYVTAQDSSTYCDATDYGTSSCSDLV